MANISLTKENIKYIRDAFSHFFPEDTVYSADKPYSSGEFNWDNRKSFIGFVFRLTGVEIKSEKDLANIKKAELVVENLAETGGAENKANAVPKAQREQFETERQAREESQKKAAADAKTAVEAAIKKQQELYEKEAARAKQAGTDLKEKKIFVKAEKTNAVKTEAVEKLRQQAKSDPQATVSVIEKTIKDRVPNIPDLAAKQASYDIVQNLQTESSPSVQTAIISSLTSNPKQFNGVIANTSLAGDFKGWLQTLSDEKLTGQELSRAITRAAFGDLFQKEVLPDFVVTFSDTPKEGFREFGLDQISRDYSSLMSRQGSFLEGLKDFGIEKVRSQIYSKVNAFLSERIQSLPADSSLRGVFDSGVVQKLLPAASLGAPAAWQAVEGSFFGKIAVSSGFAPVLGWLGEKTGIDFGIKKVAQLAVEKAAGGATGVGLAGAITAAFSWTGPFAPIIGAVGAFLINIVGAKIINKVVDWIKDNAQKNGKYIVGLVGAGFGFVLGGGSLLGAILGGAVGYGGVVAFSGGISALGAAAASFGSGVLGFFGALGGAFLTAIGMPILVTLLVFPVVVVMILFIINSGAYVVPPGVSGSPVGCTPQSTQIVQRASALAGNLKRGFNTYYNNSPDYPDLWNAALFARIPNPDHQEDSIGPEDMFWCNYMATKSFEAGNESIPFPLSTMISYFQSQQKWVNGPTATYNDVCPGDAIFFYNTFDPPGSISHVGIVAGVSADGITTFESNAPWRGWLYPTDTSGHFESTNSLNIIGFGRP